MRRGLLKLTVLALALVLTDCTCQETVAKQRFACKSNDDCASNFVCRGGECRSNDIPPGACFAGETKPCAISGCTQDCGVDGGLQACAPTSGGGFDSNVNHCGECGQQCSTRLGDLFTCVDSRCTCALDSDCPTGKVCNLGSLCVLDSDPCAKLRCPAGQVCRSGSCAAVPCDPGCDPGEICDTSSNTCRLIAACKLPVACDGGICEGADKPDGEVCDDGVACSFGDSCTAGACAGTAYSCPAPNQCQVSVACAGDGGCAVVALPDGTACNDGNDCTYSDSCASGQCAGTGYTCAPGICASTSVCNGDGGCLVTPRNAGAICDDSAACTFDDLCSDAGFCVGTAYSCPGVTECRQAGVCLGDGGCSVVDKANGTACDAGTGCTINDSCTAGVCTPGTAATTYQDSDGDGHGNSNIALTVCPAPAGFVLTGGDCNDGNANVFMVLAAVQDVDQDGFTASTALNPTACVGATQVIGGRTYYRDTAGTYTWLAAASATADCNDADPDVFNSRPSMVIDADHDGYYAAAPATACVGASQVFNGRTYYADTAGAFVYLDAAAALGSGECNDGNAIVFRTIAGLYADADHDGFTVGAAASQCVGATSTINTRTYYQDTAANFPWSTVTLGSDCNDASAATTGPTNWYLDADLDGVGGGSPTSACTAPPGQVASSTDCNDGNANISVTRTVYVDVDHDGYTTAAGQTSQCTGASTTLNGRTYYADASAAFSWALTSLGTDCDDANAGVQGPTNWYLDADGDGFGLLTNFVLACSAPGTCPGPTCRVANSTDCNDSNPLLFTAVTTVVVDNDRDGYPPDNVQTAQCAGASSTVGGRTYYSNGAGGYWMGHADCINHNGGFTQCTAPFDCYDANNNAFPGQTNYFTTGRGSGGALDFDYDCSGAVAGNPASGTYCVSTTPGVTQYTDATCVTTSGVFTRCNSPSPYALPAACGKRVSAGTNPFSLVAAVCGTTETRAAGTTIGCH